MITAHTVIHMHAVYSIRDSPRQRTMRNCIVGCSPTNAVCCAAARPPKVHTSTYNTYSYHCSCSVVVVILYVAPAGFAECELISNARAPSSLDCPLPCRTTPNAVRSVPPVSISRSLRARSRLHGTSVVPQLFQWVTFRPLLLPAAKLARYPPPAEKRPQDRRLERWVEILICMHRVAPTDTTK